MIETSLTDQQRDSLWQDRRPRYGRCALSARPGTGKTATVSSYCGDILREWGSKFRSRQGIALLSYTNVAKEELALRLATEGHSSPSGLHEPHYAGTIDAFINQFLFLPFGAQIMGCDSRPRLVGEPHSKFYADWPLMQRVKATGRASSAAFFDCYSIGVDGPIRIVPAQTKRKVGGPQPISVADVTETNRKKIQAMKEHVWSEGVAVQSDANFLALRVLREFAGVAIALARRFPVLLIDECQDMTAVQHAVIDELAKAGLANIVLVGDQYQAIYEWNTADPSLFASKHKNPDWNPKTLDATFRCSPAISSVLTALSPINDSVAPYPFGKNANYTAPVRTVPCTSSDQVGAEVVAEINRMRNDLEHCTPHSTNSNGTSLLVLARSTEHCAELQARYLNYRPSKDATESIDWKSEHTWQFSQVLASVLQQDLMTAVRRYEQIILAESGMASVKEMQHALELKWSIPDKKPGLTNYRTAISHDIQMIRKLLLGDPDPTIATVTARPWQLWCITNQTIEAVRQDYRKSLQSGANPPIRSIPRPDRNAIQKRLDGGDASVRVTFSTVHGVKGETHDGVIFALKKQTGPCGCSPSSSNQWSKILGHSLSSCETKRIAYVAISRAAQHLTIVAHSSTVDTLKSMPAKLNLH